MGSYLCFDEGAPAVFYTRGACVLEPEVLAKPEVISNFLFLGFGASAGGFLCWNLATKWIGAVRTSVYIYVSPIVTVVLSVLILHEKVTMVSVFGALLILAGLAISQKKTGGSR